MLSSAGRAAVLRLQSDWLSDPDAVLSAPPHTLIVTVTAPMPGRATSTGPPVVVVQAGGGAAAVECTGAGPAFPPPGRRVGDVAAPAPVPGGWVVDAGGAPS